MGAFLYDGQSETVQAAAVLQLDAVAAAIASNLTAPGSAAAALATDLPALIALAPDATASYAAQLATVLADYVTGIIADQVSIASPSPAPPAGFQYSSRLADLPADLSYGLAGLATIGASTIPGNAMGQTLANWQALVQLVQGSAVVALGNLYARLNFASLEDADSARAQLFDLIVAQIELAVGNDLLVQQWRAMLTASVDDLTTRAKALPDVATLATAAPLPALLLAQTLYQDGSQAPALVQRNGAPHPLFMPLSVEYLEAA